MTTDCECELSGFCKRHNVKKPNGWHKLCRNVPAFFEAWESGRGPGQNIESNAEAITIRINERLDQSRWPWWVKRIAKLRNESDVGVGDTLERLIALGGGRAYKRILAAVKLNCGCATRQAWLNRRYPYSAR